MISIPVRGENETFEDWYPRFKAYENKKLEEYKQRTEEHIERVKKIYKDHQEFMEKFNEECNETRKIINEIDQTIKEVKERREERIKTNESYVNELKGQDVPMWLKESLEEDKNVQV